MNPKEVSKYLNKTVCFDTKQFNFRGTSIKDFILSACIIRKDKKGRFFYQAELRESKNGHSVIIVPLEKIMKESEV